MLQRNGFDVEVWDFTGITTPERLSYTPPDQSNFNKCRTFLKKEEALFAIKNLPIGSFVACIVNYERRSYFLFRALSKYSIPYSLYIYNFPSFNVEKKSLIKRLMNITPSKLATHLFNTAPLNYFGIRPARIVLAVGGEYFVPKFSVGRDTKILWSHNFDYEIYLEVMRQSINQDNRMGVFLDQYFPFHPDTFGLAKPIFSPEEYYPQICRFFDHLEKTYGVHMVIAAHPRSQYETKDNLYGNRPVIRGRTAELVRKSRFVVLTDSASINYAVLFKKPMIFITTDSIQGIRMGLTDFMAGLFDKKVIHIDQSFELDWNRELMMNDKLYEEYINRYIKKLGTDDTPAWQIFADYLKNNEIGRKKKRG